MKSFSLVRALAVIGALLLLPSISFAQGGGGNVGNGGDGYEAGFRYLGSLIRQWIETGALQLDVRGISKSVDWGDVVEAIDHVPVQFTHEELTAQGSEPRVCKNYPDQDRQKRKIECNFEMWDRLPADQKLAVVFHEYLGVTGYESNEGKYSNYPLSSQLIGITANNQNQGIAKYLETAAEAGDKTPRQAAPMAVVNWLRSIMKNGTSLVARPDGNIVFQDDSGMDLSGRYLPNGDYFLKGIIGKIKSQKLGEESLSVRMHSPCGPSAIFSMVWNSEIGIKAISGERNCMYQSTGGPTRTESVIEADGSVHIEKYEVMSGSSGGDIKIEINGTLYRNHYVSPKFKAQTDQN